MLGSVFISLLLVPSLLAYSRDYPLNDEAYYDYAWKEKKDFGRSREIPQGLEEYLLQMMRAGQPRREVHVPSYKPYRTHRQFTYSLPPLVQSDFAVPPSDIRFFDPPTEIEYRDDEMGDLGEEEDIGTTKRQEKKEDAETTTQPQDEEVIKTPLIDFSTTKENVLLIALIAGCSTATVVGVALLIYGFIRLQKKAKDAADVEYPAYGVTGPNKEATPTGDRRLAHSAQMYHYQLTKQQIIAMESSSRGERRGSVSEADSEDDENEEGDYTVYECPGLAPTGEMEVKNPLFQDDPTPANSNDQPKPE